jgi:hypothetical protein
MFAIIEVENEEKLKNLGVKVVEVLDIEKIDKNDEDYKYYEEYKMNKKKDTFYSLDEIKKIFE